MRTFTIFALAGVCLCLSACRIPLSKAPLSDATSSVADERLLGVWEIDVRPLHEKFEGKPEDESVAYAVERGDGKNKLACTQLKEGKPDGKAYPLYTIHLGMHDYLSLGSSDDGSQPFVICRYEFVDDDSGKLFVMDDIYLIEQIDGGKIEGEVNRKDGKVQNIILHADGPALRKWLQRVGDKAFDTKHPLPCRRVKPSITKD
jgi:hypothetical protein